MSDGRIFDILQVHFRASEITSSAESMVSHKSMEVLATSCKEMRKVAERVGKLRPQLPQISDATVKRFYKVAPKGMEGVDAEFSSGRDVRRLSHALGQSTKNPVHAPILDGPYFELALNVLYKRWHPGFAAPLVHLALSLWNDLPPDRHEFLLSLIRGKLDGYTGNRALLRDLEKNEQYLLHRSGPRLLAEWMAQADMTFDDIWSIIAIPRTWEHLQYFDEVLISYVVALTGTRRRTIDLLSLFKQITVREAPGNSFASDTTKKCIVRILLWAEKSDQVGVQNEVVLHATRLVGEPKSEVRWSPWKNATDADTADIIRARQVLNAFISGHFIDLFFERIAHDTRRSVFWKRYYKSFPDVKLFCPEMQLAALRRQYTELSDLFSERVGVLEGTQDVAALVMKVKDYYLVEFSKAPNAFYAHRTKARAIGAMLKSGRLNISTLKHSHEMERLAKYNWETQQEGMVYHHGDWETLLRRWLAHHLKL